MKKLLLGKKGEMYIEAIVTTIVILALLLFCLSALRVATVKNKGDHIADRLVEAASFYGGFGPEFEERVEELRAEYPDFAFEVSYDADWYNTNFKRVQLGDTLSVTVTYSVTFGGFGAFVNVPMSSVRTGASENYWRTDADAG